MKQVTKLSAVTLMVLAVSGCVTTPEPNPVSIMREGDNEMSCGTIKVEYIANTEIATGKIKKNKDDDGLDFLKGFFVWPGLADFNNAPGHEGNALLDRNSRLRALAEGMDCNILDYPEQPDRY